LTRLLWVFALSALSALGQSAPRVLIIGDSISIGYTPFVAKMLAGKAVVVHNAGNAATAANGVMHVVTWLGKDKWDVIHFNFGLHDLKRLDDGERQVPPDQYERYLRLIADQLKKTGARLIFATTTPVPEGVSPPRVPSDVTMYNAIAVKVMKEKGIAVDDLNALAAAKAAEWQVPVNVHYKPEGYEGLAAQVVKSIQ